MEYTLLKKKWLIWALFIIPGLCFLLLPYYTQAYGAKYWSAVTKNAGIIAVSLFVISLSLNPLRAVFERVSLFRVLYRYRRNAGVAAFIYVLVHIFCYIMKKGGFSKIIHYLLHPVIFTGIIAFLILIPLALTSNNYSVKQLGNRFWMNLHRTVYLAEGFIFLHMLLQSQDIKILAIWLFIPLFILQYLRFKKLALKP